MFLKTHIFLLALMLVLIGGAFFGVKMLSQSEIKEKIVKEGLNIYQPAGDIIVKEALNIYSPAVDAEKAEYIEEVLPKEEDEFSGKESVFFPQEPKASEEPFIPEQKPVVFPKTVKLKVPFSPQAPFADWDDERQQDGCEEMSIIMANRWAKSSLLSREEALQELFTLSKYQEEQYGFYNDTDSDSTARLYNDYYSYGFAKAVRDITVQDIKQELAKGNLVITPMNGQIIGNPHYTSPGPERHMLVIIGYDDLSQEFITNDPGTKRGEDYRYDYTIFYNAIRDYPSGHKTAIIDESKKAMVVVSKR